MDMELSPESHITSTTNSKKEEEAESYPRSLLESYFEYLYANAIIEQLIEQFRNLCLGCQEARLSQRNHICVLTKEEQLKLHFDWLLSVVDEEDVVQNWHKVVTCLDMISDEFSSYREKITSRQWRDTEMKTLLWKKRLTKTAIQILQLNKRVDGSARKITI